jgi:hypothetical protein
MQRTATVGEQRFISDVMQRLSRQVIAAGKADEAVADGGGPTGKNSLFTGHLLDGVVEHDLMTAFCSPGSTIDRPCRLPLSSQVRFAPV